MVTFNVMEEPCLAVLKARFHFHISLASQDPMLSHVLGFSVAARKTEHCPLGSCDEAALFLIYTIVLPSLALSYPCPTALSSQPVFRIQSHDFDHDT